MPCGAGTILSRAEACASLACRNKGFVWRHEKPDRAIGADTSNANNFHRYIAKRVALHKRPPFRQ